MTLFKSLKLGVIGAAAMVCLNYTNITAVCDDTYIDLYGGWRTDEVKATVESFSLADPDTLVETDKVKGKNLHSWEVGLKGRYTYCNWLLRGYGSYGWIHSGKYTEKVTNEATGAVSTTKADVDHGHTADASIGIGYYFSFDDWYDWDPCCNEEWSEMAVAPVLGWSYHRTKFDIDDAEVDGIAEPLLNELTYTNRWQGPWVGVDLLWRNCEFAIHTGYEFHWANWRATWKLDGADSAVGFSDRRKSHHGHGHVFYIDGDWQFSDCWIVGLGVRLQAWRAKKGHLEAIDPNFVATTVDEVKNARWFSAEVTLDLGYRF